MVFRGVPLDQARRRFEEIKGMTSIPTTDARIERRRKLKLDRPDNK
jgi:hypothetical protein